MFVAVVLTIISIAGGTLLTYSYDYHNGIGTRIAQGAPLGLAGLGLVGLVCSALAGLNPVTLFVSSSCLVIISCLLARSRGWARVGCDIVADWRKGRASISSPRKRDLAVALVLGGLALMLWQVFDRSVFFSGGTLYTGVEHNYGDLPFHLTVITRFAYGANIPPEDPVFAGTRFTYPYLADFISAMLLRAGAGLRGSILLETLVLAVSLLWLLFKWTLELTGDTAAALIGPALILLGGGWGFAAIFGEARQTERGLLDLVLRPIHDYGIVTPEGPGWGDSLTYLLVTQRSMLLGLPLAIIIFSVWWRSGRFGSPVDANGAAAESGRRGTLKSQLSSGSSSLKLDVPMLAAGVIAGFLPVCHTHTFLVVLGVGLGLAVLSRDWRSWLSFFIPAVLLGASQSWSISHGSAVRFGNFFTPHFGWQSGRENVFWFWLKNTGVMIPLVVFAVVNRRIGRVAPVRLLLYYAPFIACFVIPNLIKLAPWPWDNIKVLFYWYVASAPVAALVLTNLWRRGGWGRISSALLTASLLLSGSLNVIRVITSTRPLSVFNPEQLAFAEVIKQDTPADALILHAPVHDDPVFLTGRRSFMGYPGHIWTHGIDYLPREDDIRVIYEGGPGARDLIAEYNIQYAVVSPQERNLMRVDDAFFERFGKVAEVGEYSLYKTR